MSEEERGESLCGRSTIHHHLENCNKLNSEDTNNTRNTADVVNNNNHDVWCGGGTSPVQIKNGMAADDGLEDGVGTHGGVDALGGRKNKRPFSVRGTYRQKHKLRAIFRSGSLILLLGGYALYHRFGSGGGGNVVPGNRGVDIHRLRSGGVKNSVDVNDISFFDDESHTTLRLLEGENQTTVAQEAGANVEALERVEQSSDCPSLPVAEPTWLAAFYAIGTLYMFLALAIVCDEFFVPALEEISCEHHLNLSMDVAGATLMAAGGSAPELFTSLVGTFQESDIGIGTIVGSAVFNVLFVIGMCSILSKEVLTLTWWPLFRDTSYYAVGLIVLSLLAGVLSKGEVNWWESCILLAMYVGYVVLMYFNRRLYKKLTGKELVLGGEDEEGGEESAANGNGAVAAVPKADTELNGSALTADSSAPPNEENGVSSAPSKEENGDSSPSNASSDDFVESSNKAHAKTASTRSIKLVGDDPPPTSPKGRDFRWPGTFRAGVLKLLLHPESFEEKGGLGIVAKIHGDVDHVFRQIDINGDGSIDKEELGNLFRKLGHEISGEELSTVFASLDLDGNGTICEDEFSKWYVKSEERILSKVKPIFDTFDADKSGTIDRDEVRQLLRTLEPTVTETDVDDAIKAMYKSGSTEEITYEEFADWYVHSIIYTKQQERIEQEMEAEAQGVCEALKPPRGEGIGAWIKYLLVLPLVAVLTFTIPDVRRPGLGKWCYLAFILSIVWIGIFSYFMVGWAEILGNTMGVPSVVMGYTVLAAGTSVPDLLSSVIVARMGEGDMAVSSSIGSNIFDILVGLPLPWLLFTIIKSKPVVIQAAGIWQSIFILIGMLVAIIAIVHCQGWKMTRTLGWLMFLLYFAFLVQAILTEYYRNPCFG